MQHQILNSKIERNEWKTERRIEVLILGVKELNQNLYLYAWERKVMWNIIISFEGNGKTLHMYTWFHTNIDSNKGDDSTSCCNDDAFCNYLRIL